MRIVLLGGGTGISNILTGLKQDYGKKIKKLTAIVTVSDSGGSSGTLKKIYDIPAVGDIRNCLLSLSKIENYVNRVMQYRFQKGDGLKGHPLGNLFLVALLETEGDFIKAIKKASKILDIEGEVMPASLEKIDLIAKFENGKIIKGEEKIVTYASRYKKRIKSLKISPRVPFVSPEVIKRIKKADMILFGPGSLFTSILPNLLIPPIFQAIKEAKGIKVLIVNLLTQSGETDGYKASDHLVSFLNFSKLNKVDALVINKTKPGKKFEKQIMEEGKSFVEPDIDKIKKILNNVKIYLKDLANTKDIYFKHDPIKLKKVIFEIAQDFNII